MMPANTPAKVVLKLRLDADADDGIGPDLHFHLRDRIAGPTSNPAKLTSTEPIASAQAAPQRRHH